MTTAYDTWDFDRDEWNSPLSSGASFLPTATNGGGMQNVIGITGTFGVGELFTGAISATGAAGFQHEHPTITLPCNITVNTSWTLEFRLYIPTLSAALQRFKIQIGYLNAVNGTPTEGVWFEYADNVNGGQWVLNTKKTSGGAGNTATNTASAPVAGTIYRLKIVVTGTSAQFFIDDVSQGTIATNVPTASVSIAACIVKSVGTASRTLDFDKITQTILF